MSKVIVVDDEPFILMMIQDKLTKAGFDVITLRESIEAVEVIRKELPDLVILDWMMPDLSGLEICRILKSDPDLQSIPIFMLTAKGQDSDERLGISSGVSRYITKPFSPKSLLGLVEETVGKKKH
jgi:DNA-binding response OmpR family regulator